MWTSVARPSDDADPVWSHIAAMPEEELRALVEDAVAKSKATLEEYEPVFDDTVSAETMRKLMP